MADIVISEFMAEEAVDAVLGDFDVQYDPALVDDRARLLDALAVARAVIVRNRTRVDSELLNRAPRLRAVGRLGVGLDNIDVDACRARAIAVYPASGANDQAVAEYVIAASMMLLRGVFTSTARIIAGDWPRTELIGREAADKQLGLIGFGSIARQVACRAAALGFATSAFDPFVRDDDAAWSLARRTTLDGIAASADVVSVHVPLTDDTRHLVDAGFISRMRTGAVLINTARGGVVDESAVMAALRDGRLGGAAFDVFEHEPVDAESGTLLADVPNLLLTPHIAGVTQESNLRVSYLTAESIAAHLRG